MSVIFLQEGRAKRQRIKAAHTDRMTKITEKTISNKKKRPYLCSAFQEKSYKIESLTSKKYL